MGLRTDLRGKRVLVTGAASGIGRAVAVAAAARGARLVLTDVRAGPLAEVAARLADAVELQAPCDLADHDAVLALGTAVHARCDAVDVVMNVAGISTWGEVDMLEHRHWTRTLDVDLVGPISVIETFVAPMVRAGRGGHLVNVSSAAGLLGLPFHAPYSAAKFGLRGVSEVLRFDLRRHGIGVTLVCPGAVRTPLVGTVDIVGVDRDAPAVRAAVGRFERHAASPERVAEQILDAVERGRYLVHTSRLTHAAFLLQRYLPPVYALVMQGLNDRMARVLTGARSPGTGAREGAGTSGTPGPSGSAGRG